MLLFTSKLFILFVSSFRKLYSFFSPVTCFIHVSTATYTHSLCPRSHEQPFSEPYSNGRCSSKPGNAAFAHFLSSKRKPVLETTVSFSILLTPVRLLHYRWSLSAQHRDFNPCTHTHTRARALQNLHGNPTDELPDCEVICMTGVIERVRLEGPNG